MKEIGELRNQERTTIGHWAPRVTVGIGIVNEAMGQLVMSRPQTIDTSIQLFQSMR